MLPGASDTFLRLTPSGEIYLKSARTRRRFMDLLEKNVSSALEEVRAASGAVVELVRSGGHELRIDGPDAEKVAEVAAQVFGVAHVDVARRLPFSDVDELARQMADYWRDEIRGRVFAVRVKRRGTHEWRSADLERRIGALLLDDSAGVDLTNPEVMLRLDVYGDVAIVVLDRIDGPGGFPLGAQDRVLVLLSGGIDSPVAAWLMMRRGTPVDLLHFKLDCSQSDHALAVGHELIREWGHGADTTFHVIDFEGVKAALRESVPADLRQVVLKQLMVQAASRVAGRLRIPALVMGDSLGQVSSQTLPHLVAVDGAATRPILRPLLTFTKDEIMAWARRIGTYELSIRAREVCDLSDGRRVKTAATRSQIARGTADLDTGIVDEALSTWERIDARAWAPGLPLDPVPDLAG